MSQAKSYEVIIKSTANWTQTIEARSLREAKRIAEDEFNEGRLRQCEEEVISIIAWRQRTRTGSWSTFERRFKPLPAPDHDYLWDIGTVPKEADYRYWWTVRDCEGRLYISPGFRFVNRFAFIRCTVPWTEDDERQPDYRYD